MADNAEEYENETNDVSEPKGLRAQLEKALAENKELKTELQTVKSTVREKTLSEVLNAKGVNTKVSKFIPEDINGVEEIEEWLTDNADVFGFTVNDEQVNQTPKSVVTDEEKQSANRLQNLNQSAQTPSKFQDFETRLANATSKKEIDDIMREAKQFLL